MQLTKNWLLPLSTQLSSIQHDGHSRFVLSFSTETIVKVLLVLFTLSKSPLYLLAIRYPPLQSN